MSLLPYLRHLLCGSLAVAGLLAAPGSARAETLLYCVDYSVGTDHMYSAFATYSSSHSVTYTTSMTTCESYIASSSWDLVIMAIQNYPSTSTPYFNAYVASGGKAILQDWTLDSTRGSYVGISYGIINQNSVTVSDASLASGLASNPFALTNPGWSVYSFALYTSYTYAATFSTGYGAIVIGNSGDTIVNGFLTDTISSSTTAVQLYKNEIDYLLNACDADGDGYDATTCSGGTDCDDSDASINPGASEICYDGVDQNCDLWSDYDCDLDGYDASAWGGTDCSDADASINPGMADTCYDGVDQNCDGANEYDCDLDSYTSDVYGGNDCDDSDAAINPGATDVWYDGVDTDCDGWSDYDQDLDGYDSDVYGGDDCDDTVSSVNPSVSETCYDGVDSNCDGWSDYDCDIDGYDSDAYGGTDCDDTDAAINPSEDETS